MTIRRAAGLLAFVMCISMVFFPPMRASAAGGCTLTVEYASGDKTPIPGATFRAWRIAERKGGAYVLTGAFSDYSVSLEHLNTTAELQQVADTLSIYVARDTIDPDGTGKTDSAGTAKITGLQEGLYLVMGDAVEMGEWTHTPQSAIVYLSSGNTTVKPKDDPTPLPPPEEDPTTPPSNPSTPRTVQILVVKVWNDDGYDQRPNQVVMQLLRNGKVYDEVTLTAAKNWRHRWVGLQYGYTWQVMEKEVPEGYTMAVDWQGDTFTVTNSRVPEEPVLPVEPTQPVDPVEPTPPTQPVEPDRPIDPQPTEPGRPVDPVDPVEPDVPGEPVEPVGPPEPDQPKIPQTGQLWWPALLLAGSGLVLTAAGILLCLPGAKRKDEGND